MYILSKYIIVIKNTKEFIMGVSSAIAVGGLIAGSIASKRNAPKAPAIPAAPPAASPPTYASSSVVSAGQTAKKAAAGSTVNPTGGQGLVKGPDTSPSKLLG